MDKKAKLIGGNMFSKDNPVITWLLENDNPAIAYRTKTELLNEYANKDLTIEWFKKFLPQDWQDAKGLWSTYWLTSIAECGLTYNDIPFKQNLLCDETEFDCGCGDFMKLRAMVKLGYKISHKIIEIIKEKQLPDGGFLCLHRLDKLKYIPKSCVKVNMHALMFCAECKKKNINLNIENKLISYFWNHHLFYRRDNLEELILNSRQGWRTIDTFFPFEVMRIGLQNFIEGFCALGYGNDNRLKKAWDFLNQRRTEDNKYTLDGTCRNHICRKSNVINQANG